MSGQAPRKKSCMSRKPHLGTDKTCRDRKDHPADISRSARGEVRFRSKVTDFLIEEGKVRGVVVNGQEKILSPFVVLAVGQQRQRYLQITGRKKDPYGAKVFCGRLLERNIPRL